MTSEDNNEITVKAPSKPVTAPEERDRKKAEKSLEEQRFNVLELHKKISQYISITLFLTGASLLGFLIYAAATGQVAGLFSSSPLGLGAWVFVGLINIVVGFLLLGRE
jgi:hypothetical protein